MKKVTSKTRAARKMSLVGERCTFNVENHAGLRAKLESILEDSIDVTVQSSRVCRPCGRQTESLEKRYKVGKLAISHDRLANRQKSLYHTKN